MKVLLLDVNCKSGSTGKIIYDLYTQLNEHGHTAAIGYGRGQVVKGPNIMKFSSNIEVYIHAFLTRITGFTGYFSYFATRRLIKFIDKFRPDVVHLNDMHGYFVNIFMLIKYLKKNNIKVVWTFHCEFMYTGKCGHSYECQKWKAECDNCPNLKDYPASMFLDFTRRMFNHKKEVFKDFNNLIIAAPSRWLADRAKQSFLKDKKIIVIHNGIDTKNIFYPRQFEHLKKRHNITNEKIVLSVAPDIMCERKGGKYVLELAGKLKNEKVKFILIGVKNLKERFDDNVIALGRTENQIELAGYYSMADVFVICSKKENFPTTCLEAISCGTPICGFDEGGVKETAPDKLGVFVPYGNVEDLRQAVVTMLENKNHFKVWEGYGNNMYSRERMFSNYLKVYE